MKAYFSVAAAILSAAMLTACPTVPQADGGLRFVNAVTDSGGFKVFFGDVRKNTDGVTKFREAFPSTGYVAQAPGKMKYSLCDDFQLDCGLKNLDLTVKSGINTSILMVGTATSSDDTGATPRPLELVTLEDTPGTPAAGKAKLRVVHAVAQPSANKVDMYITAPTDSLGGFPTPLNYKQDSGYRDVTAGTWRIRVTEPNVTDVTLLDSGSLVLEAGKTYSILLTTPGAGNGVSLLAEK